MKNVLVATALAIFGLAPAIGAACQYVDASSASMSAPLQIGSAPTPSPEAASVPAPAVAKAQPPNEMKRVTRKVKLHLPDQKIVVGATN